MLGLPTVAREDVGHLQPLAATCMRESVAISFWKPATTNSSADCSPSDLLLTRFRPMALGSRLAHLGGYPFDVRYSDGSLVRACAAADVAADAYVYFSRLFSGVVTVQVFI